MFGFTGSQSRRAFAAFICSCLAGLVQASDTKTARVADPRVGAPAQAIQVETTPGWVRERTIPVATKVRLDRAQGGTAYLLVDEQYSTRRDGRDAWFRSSTKVTNRNGLESAGQISVTYNPSFESVGVNFIHVIRNGKLIDLTKQTQFRVVEREDELSDGILSGTLKAMANLTDVREGDIVDYATTTHTRNTLWPGHAFYSFSQRYSDPVAMRALRLIWPAGMDARSKSINSEVAFPPRKTAEGTEWEWIAIDPSAMQAENDVPRTAFQWGRIDVSTMKSWSEVARWTAAIYQGDESLPTDFSARLDAIAAASRAPADRLTEATRFVQDNIRYVGEELSEGSYVPRRPKTVLAHGYGDCKDKSLLLAVALRRLGIDAVPALVSSTVGERLPDRLPSPLDFDHVIVRAMLDGKVIWIDPTGAHRGGRGAAIVPSDLGYALPIRSEQIALEPIAGFREHAGRMSVLEQFTVDETADVPLNLRVETQFTDSRADNMRSTWARKSAKQMADSNLEFYHSRFPGLLESKPLEIHDDRDGNRFTMIENYRMSREAFSGAKLSSKLVTRAYALQNVLPDRQANPRAQALIVGGHLVNEQIIELRVKDRVLGGLPDLDGAGPISFSRKTSKLPDGVRVVYSLVTGTRDFVPASEAEAIYKVSDQVKDEIGTEFYLEQSERPSTASHGLDAATWSALKPEMDKVLALVQKADERSKLDALSLLAALSGKVAHPSPAAGLIDGMKGGILADLQRPEAAWAALQSATAQFDGNPDAFRLWIAYEIDLGTGESIGRAMQRTLKVQPEVIAKMDKQWVRAAMQKARAEPPEKRKAARADICIALVQGGWQQDPRTAFGGDMLGCAIAAHDDRGQLAEARAELSKEPPTDTLLSLAIDRRHQALWSEIDRLGKDGFRKSLELESARASAAAKASPQDYAVVTLQMEALRNLGRYEEALVAGKALAGNTTQVEVVGNDGFWLVNEYAENLHALGRMDEAMKAFDGLIALGINHYPELASLAINRAETAIAAGRYQLALESLSDVEAHHLDKLSTFGKMWVWADKACALRALGRGDEAKVQDLKLQAKADENWSATTSAAACRADPKAIAAILISRLRESEARAGALRLFIENETPETLTPFGKTKKRSLTEARAMPEVQAEFRKHGRVVPYAGTN